MPKTIQSDLVTPEAAAEYLGVAVQTLAVWRITGRYGLPYIKMGRRIRYRQRDLDAFIESRTCTSTGQADGLKV